MDKNIIVTGASGLVATELTHLLLSLNDNYKIYAVSTNPDKLKERYENCTDIKCLSLQDLEKYADTCFEAVIHCAFARSNDAKQIASSLQFTENLLQIVRVLRPGVFVNISSQSIYGQANPPLWKEDAPPAPDYLYALGKYSTELLTSAYLDNSGIKYTNIRLSSVCENARFLNIFAKNALSGNPVNVLGGTQRCAFIDVRDVADALKTVIEQSITVKLRNIYNLGTGETRTILELAEDTKRIAKAELGLQVAVNVQASELRQEVGMDVSLFRETFGWSPCYGYDDMIRSLLALNGANFGGGVIPISFSVLYKRYI